MPKEKERHLKKQENINKAINHFLAHKQYPSILNKILKNYTETSTHKPRGFTFGLFKRFLKYAIKHPKHSYYLIKLIQSPSMNDRLTKYYQQNFNNPILKRQLIKLSRNELLIELLYSQYKPFFTQYNLKLPEFKTMVKIIATGNTINIVPVFLNNTKNLLEIAGKITENKLGDATQQILELLEKEPEIKKYTQDLAMKIKIRLPQLKSLKDILPIKELNELPNKPTADLISLILNSINTAIFAEGRKLLSEKNYVKLIIFVLQTVKLEHTKKNSELITFLSSNHNKAFLKQIITILFNKMPSLASSGIPNDPEHVANALCDINSINTLVNLIINWKEGNKLKLLGNITTAARDPNIKQGALQYIKSFFWKTNNPIQEKQKRPVKKS